jgi:nucleoside-diphosphate-sugar epimerase
MTLRELVTKMEEVSGLQAVIDEEAKLPNPIPMNYVSDISRVDQELGWQPTMPMADGLKSLFAA